MCRRPELLLVMTDEIERHVTIPIDGVELEGELVVPVESTGLVVFSHGSGSSRKSPRNNFVARTLQRRGLATLLFDLLTEDEDREYERRFDISLLTDRLVAVTAWLDRQPATSGLHYGYFGSSTGAASALGAAARRKQETGAVVSRGGRVDLAAVVFDEVTWPTLLIVGERDHQVLERNRAALEELDCETNLEVVEGASHLFEEPGTLERVATLAADWFTTYLDPSTSDHAA